MILEVRSKVLLVAVTSHIVFRMVIFSLSKGFARRTQDAYERNQNRASSRTHRIYVAKYNPSQNYVDKASRCRFNIAVDLDFVSFFGAALRPLLCTSGNASLLFWAGYRGDTSEVGIMNRDFLH